MHEQHTNYDANNLLITVFTVKMTFQVTRSIVLKLQDAQSTIVDNKELQFFPTNSIPFIKDVPVSRTELHVIYQIIESNLDR